MLNKIRLFIEVFLAVVAGFFYWQTKSLENKNIALTAEKTVLKEKNSGLNNELKGCRDEFTKQSEANQRANSTIGEIKTIIKTVESHCDCYNTPIDSVIIGRVRGTKK